MRTLVSYCSVIQRFEAMAGRGEELFEIGGEIGFFGGEVEPVFFRFGARCGRGDVAIIDRTFFGEGMRGNLRDDFSVILDDAAGRRGDFADDGGIEAPLFENVEHFVFAAFFGDEEHALLRFAEHDFVGSHAGFALGNVGEIDFDAGVAARSHFAGGAGEAGGAHVLDADDGSSLHGFEAGFEKKFFDEGIADLDVGALLLGLFGEFGGGESEAPWMPSRPVFAPT